MHHLLVVGVELPDSRQDPGLDLLGDLVPHNGLELRLLQTEIREDETLVVWILLPHDSELRAQIEEVPLPDGVEGLFGCIIDSLIYLEAVSHQKITVSHEDSGRLP